MVFAEFFGHVWSFIKSLDPLNNQIGHGSTMIQSVIAPCCLFHDVIRVSARLVSKHHHFEDLMHGVLKLIEGSFGVVLSEFFPVEQTREICFRLIPGRRFVFHGGFFDFWNAREPCGLDARRGLNLFG